MIYHLALPYSLIWLPTPAPEAEACGREQLKSPELTAWFNCIISLLIGTKGRIVLGNSLSEDLGPGPGVAKGHPGICTAGK